MANPNNDTITQYLTFKLGEEVFALDVARVREVLDMAPITKVPQSADFMRGVINVRGSVVPVVDLRKKFGMPEAELTVDTRIVVMEIELEDGISAIGAQADSVHHVMEITPQQIEAPPKIGAKWRTDFIKGIGKTEDTFIIILDIDRVFSFSELTELTDNDALRTEQWVETVV